MACGYYLKRKLLSELSDYNAAPNNSFNRSANSAALIVNLDGFSVVSAPG
jgi:hypothetical protein